MVCARHAVPATFEGSAADEVDTDMIQSTSSGIGPSQACSAVAVWSGSSSELEGDVFLAHLARVTLHHCCCSVSRVQLVVSSVIYDGTLYMYEKAFISTSQTMAWCKHKQFTPTSYPRTPEH